MHENSWIMTADELIKYAQGHDCDLLEFDMFVPGKRPVRGKIVDAYLAFAELPGLVDGLIRLDKLAEGIDGVKFVIMEM